MYRARHFGFSIRTMYTLYLWYIRTSLEYASPVWHSSITVQQTNRLERVQKRCLRIILGDGYIEYTNALRVLGCSTLEGRREQLTLRFGRNLLRSPTHRDMLPPTMRDVHGRNTRHHNRLREVRCRTERYRRSTIPYLVRKLT